MQSYSVQEVIKLRQQIHANPEGGFQQFQTQKRIFNFLTSIGIQSNLIQQKAKTGLIIDLKGRLPAQGNKRTVAFRADMDALSMVQDNAHLSYQSNNGKFAHMCGHDGHTACLAAFAWKYLKYLDEIPENRTVRLIFQPCEEGPESGAKLMVEQGVLEGVDEVYAFHNVPTELPGKIYIQQGGILYESVVLKIRVIGTMGHGSAPQKVKDSIKASVKIYTTIQNKINQLQQNKHNIKCTLPMFNGGQRHNVFSEDCEIEGSVRSNEKGLCKVVVDTINQVIKELEQQGFTVQFKPHYYAPVVFNTKQQTQHVIKQASELYGAENVSNKFLPFPASDDFAYFLEQRPGAYFFGSSALTERNAMVHSNQYDFNDSMIDPIGELWLRLALNRMKSE